MAAKAGWYPDPYDNTQYAGFRYWNGGSWTHQVERHQPSRTRQRAAGAARVYIGEYEVAGLWRRFGASTLDGLVLGVLSSILLWPWLLRLETEMAMLQQALLRAQGQSHVALPAHLVERLLSTYAVLLALTALVRVAYATLTVSLFSATMGKLALRLRVVSADRSRIRWWQALVRGLVAEGALMTVVLGPVLLVVAALFPIIDCLTALFNDRHRTLHDLAAGTVVVRA